ncbi:MupA/Atu3671 family FMN-dependent luciferase-like monooxygenase [Polymorphospora sp. A560]
MIAAPAPAVPAPPATVPAPRQPAESVTGQLPPAGSPAAPAGGAIADLAAQLQEMVRQSQLIEEQLAVLRSATAPPAAPQPPAAAPAPVAAEASAAGTTEGAPAAPDTPAVDAPVVHGPRVTVAHGSGMTAGQRTDAQRTHVDELRQRLVAKTRTSREITQRYRRPLADSRAVVGFRSGTKEMLYPIAGQRARGSWLEDVDGNRYVDITMGFGVLLFGHEPQFVTEAVREHLSRGVQLGPRSIDTGEAAVLLSEMVGLPRVAFANSGTEANSAAIRLARAATGRDKIVMFHGSYHGHADNVLGRSNGTGADRVTVPVSTGIPGSAVSDLVVLDYGAPESLAVIESLGSELAAVIVEPIQSRHPTLRPVEFLHSLREITTRHGIVLMFDEMLTGFRPHPRGAQGLFGVTPDLATYGKALGGGFPIGAIAGREDIMDGVDGGFWQYGDDSRPPRETTFFGGTYIQHPVSMVAARAVLTHLKQHSPHLQERLNARTDELVGSLNRFFEDEEFPVRLGHFGSQFRFEHRADMELLYHHLLLKGVFVWEWRNFFLSTAHTDADVEQVADAVRDSLREMRAAGYFPTGGGVPVPAATPVPARTAGTTAPAAAGTPGTTAPVARTAEAAVPVPPTTHASAPVARTADAVARTEPVSEPAPAGTRTAPDFSVYFFGDYPAESAPEDKYRTIVETARYADTHGFHSLWMPERHFHSFGGVFPNPVVLAAALARETTRIRLNAGSVVLPLHDPVRVAEEWSMVDNLSAGRVGIGCASGWHANDFVLAPQHFGRHREVMYEQLDQIRRLWRGESVTRRSGSGDDVAVRVFPRPVQSMPPMFTAVVGRPESFQLAAEHDLGVITNLMSQSVEQLADNIVLYRKARAAHGLDPGRVVVLAHTFVGPDGRRARAEAFEPLRSYMRSSLSLFGQVTNSLGFQIDMDNVREDDLDFVFERAYERYCESRALIGTPDECAAVVESLVAAGVDEIAALVDFGVPADRLADGLPHLDLLRRRSAAEPAQPAPAPAAPIEVAPAPARPAADVDGPPRTAPLSPGQRRIWFLDRLFPGRSAYNEPAFIRLDGPLDVPALRAALDQLVERHPAIRTVFVEVDGEPVQRVLPPAGARFTVEDHTGADEAAVCRAAVERESTHVFDLTTGPLFHARLLRLAETRHVLVLSFHHVVVDATSATVVTRDLSELYRARVEGGPVALPALPRGYADFAVAQVAALGGGKARDDLAYWRERLGGELPVLALPTDRPRPPVMGTRGRSVVRLVEPAVATALRTLASRHRATLFMVLTSAFAATIGRFSGQEEIIVGTPVTDRPAGAEEVVGFFLNTLALRLDLTGDPAFTELLARTRATALAAYDHADVPFETVVGALAPERDTSRNPIFQVIAEFENDVAFRLDLPGVTATTLDVGADRAVVDLVLYLTNRSDGIGARLEYNVDLFEESTARRLADAFTGLLAAVAADPGAPLSRLGAPTAADRETLDRLGSGPVRPVSDECLHTAVERWAAATPQSVAVIGGGAVLTYGQLDARADELAGRLRAAGTGPGDVVALWLPRSPDLVVAMLAVLKTGAAYLPLDPGLGTPRVRFMVEDSRARVLLSTSDAVVPPLPDGVATLHVDITGDAPAAGTAVPADDPDAAGYVIYTSGSTGRPKGVAVSHRAVRNLSRWHADATGTTPADRHAVVCGQSFDASVLEVWPALVAGASLAIADDHVRLDPAALARWYRTAGVTLTILPTALAEAVLALPVPAQPPLRHLMIGGDRLRTRPHPGVSYQVSNVYGPTETTVLATTAVVADPTVDDGPISIGRPVDNVRLHVLDPAGRAVPVGARGELYIGGPGLALGYLHRPDLTAERFVTGVPAAPGERLYRTGDLVRWNPAGELEFLGRIDDQVKVRGYRVEPAEVAAVLLGLAEVADGVVTAPRDRSGDAYLAAYVVPAGGADPDGLAGRLADALARELPDHMVPRAWAFLPALPVNSNGKVDRAALPAPGLQAGPSGTAPAAGPAPSEVVSETAAVPPAPAAAVAPAARPAPPDDLERTVREMWCAELDRTPDQTPPEASFFALGGHSITAMRLLGRVREATGVEYPVLRFFRAPTIRAMADHLREQRPATAARVRGTL